MTQKERDELQRYLDERIFGTKRQMRSKYADKLFMQRQKDILYLIVKDVKVFVAKKAQNSDALDDAINKVACCLRQINFHAMKPNPKNSRDIVPRDKMPFLAKQVLWLICYKALQAGLKQKDVYDELDRHKISVSHNFFSSLEQTPDYFLRCEKYLQPENPCKYKGQKKDELAVAIKNLVYQAGSHSHFVDIFGGSGSASVAVCRKRTVKYAYNEKNEAVYNYIRKISGDDYKDIIEGLCSIQDDLLSSDNNTCSAYMKFDFCTEIGNYISFKQNNSKRKMNQGDLDIIALEREIQGYTDSEFVIDKQSLAKLMARFPNEIQVFKNEIEILLREKKIFRGISTFKELEKMNTVADFYRYENDFYFLSLKYLITWGLSSMQGMYVFDEITYDEWRKMLRQFKALGYYAYFYLLSRKTGNDVARAVGEIFLWYFSVQGSIVSTSIIYDLRSTVWNEPFNNIYNFLQEDFAVKVKKFHDALSGTIIKNKDFRGIIQDYSDKNTLFYSDSPYIATSDYDDEVGGVSKFSRDDMKDLIKGLMQGGKTSGQKATKKASKPNKFIFSMRAVKSGEEINGSGKDAKIVSGNQEICQYVYKEFAAYKKSLYVLVIYEKGKDLCDLIQKSKSVEIMITNYEIVSFEAKGTGKKKYVCKAFTFDEYLKHIKANMVGYEKSWGL